VQLVENEKIAYGLEVYSVAGLSATVQIFWREMWQQERRDSGAIEMLTPNLLQKFPFVQLLSLRTASIMHYRYVFGVLACCVLNSTSGRKADL